MIERLQKYMARCGVASRRKCEEYILAGKVKVNGLIIKELGTKIDDSKDIIYLNNNLIKPEEKKIYVMLNKPTGYVTTVKDEKSRATVLDLIDLEERIYPIGRLDYNTSGLLLLTNDGEVYNKIIHPREAINKIYIATLKGHINNNKVLKFKSGINIGGYVTAPANIEIIKEYNDSSKVKITIHEGKNRQIRKMCNEIGNPVITLQRIKIGNIELGNLQIGTWRYLSSNELSYIQKL
ncbi:rRNA pseudouridine synthase [Clostridium sp. 19966]|uniref:pseudouridine synthase n=1 Tax=Clostridium sp. 19966 TaxID=2768166 RepID=UPI0028E07B13|nr:pseudouridine synthase [Clostridium sp. 19966]MDT8716380.1 rRNA pseudouridine synthase [Clostridium sp. 19966]